MTDARCEGSLKNLEEGAEVHFSIKEFLSAFTPFANVVHG